jgi:hypothetical protein
MSAVLMEAIWIIKGRLPLSSPASVADDATRLAGLTHKYEHAA